MDSSASNFPLLYLCALVQISPVPFQQMEGFMFVCHTSLYIARSVVFDEMGNTAVVLGK